MKRILVGLVALTLLLSACGPAGNKTEVPSGLPETGQAAATREQKVLVLADLSESQQAAVMAAVMDAGKAYNKLVEYVIQGPSSERLKRCFAGAKTREISEWITDSSELLIIYLSDPEDAECLKELASLGLGTEYKVEKGIGTREYLIRCEKEIKEKLAALEAKKSFSDGEKTLIKRYMPRNVNMDWSMGRIWIEVTIKSPWYSYGENWTTEDMYKDLDRCRQLFRELIGDYEVVSFVYGV